MDVGKVKYANLRRVSVEEVIRIEVNEGTGVIGQDDPVIRIVYWFTKDGNLIGHNDDAERLYRAGTNGAERWMTHPDGGRR